MRTRAKTYPGLFTNRYSLQGSDWVRKIPEEDLRVFVTIGLEAHEHGKLGGRTRAATAKRDSRGRFVPNDDKDVPNDDEDGGNADEFAIKIAKFEK